MIINAIKDAGLDNFDNALTSLIASKIEFKENVLRRLLNT